MGAREKIVELLKARGSDGVMQSEICSALRLSKSTVSEILTELEEERSVVKEKIGRAFRVWLAEFAPFPVEGILRIGVLKAAEYPHVLMAAKKFNARIVVFENALNLTKAIAMGSVDIGFSPLVTQVLFGLLLKSIKIHAVVAYNGSGVVSRKRIEDTKTFATSELSAMESNLKLFLDRLGIKGKIRYFNSVERMISAFKYGEFDAVAVWEPYYSFLSGYKYEFSEVIGDFPCCSMASNAVFYSSNREEIAKFRKEMENCMEEMSEDDAVKALSLLGFGTEVRRAIRSYKFSAGIGKEDIEFLENYGIKLTDENVRVLVDPL